MSTTWYLMKYVPDLRRREPRNVGVIMRASDGSWSTMFLGEGADGRIDGRRIRGESMNLDAYRSWVEFFRRKASDSRWPDVARLQKRRTGNYFVEPGGSTAGPTDDNDQRLRELYAELVRATPLVRLEPIPALTPMAYLRQRVDEVLSSAQIVAERNVQVEAIFEGRRTTVPFGYGYTNGQRHLMDVVHRRIKPDDAAADARELRSRLEGARAAGSATSFFSFYSSNIIDDDRADEILYPVEELSIAIDVENQKEAIGQIQRRVLTR